jgi:predicted site-specific integrase-resolvase
MITVYELSYMLDVDEKTLRRWLREDYPKRAPGKGNRWEITTQMARRMVRRAHA